MSLSGDENAAFPRHEYETIEKAVMESARGRWFLQEFARRNRAADTLTLLDAIGRLQSALAGGSVSPAASTDVVSLAETLKSVRAEIARMRDDRLPDGGVIHDDSAIYSKIAEHAKVTAERIVAGTHRLQELAGDLRAANANEAQVASAEAGAHDFETLAWSQDILSRRIAKAMGLLSDVDGRITAMVPVAKPQPIEPRHLKYFAPDESLFDPSPRQPQQAEPLPPEPKGVTVVVHRVNAPEATAEVGQPPMPPAHEMEPPGEDTKKRVVVIRKPRSDAVEIPLAGELPEQVA